MSVGVRPTTIRARAAAALGALALVPVLTLPAAAAGQTASNVGTCSEWRVVRADGTVLTDRSQFGDLLLERGAAYRIELRVFIRSDLWNGALNSCDPLMTSPDPGLPNLTGWRAQRTPLNLTLVDSGTSPSDAIWSSTLSLRRDLGASDIDHTDFLLVQPTADGSTLPATYRYEAFQPAILFRYFPFGSDLSDAARYQGVGTLPAAPTSTSAPFGFEFSDVIVLPFTVKADAPEELVYFRLGAGIQIIPQIFRFTEGSGGGGDGAGNGAATTPLLSGGAAPGLTPGTAVWQQADGTTVPLPVSSPAAGQLRYQTDGLRITLTGGAGTSASGGLVVAPGGEITCEVCVDLATGEVIEAWMFSQPRLVAAHRVGDDPCQRFTIPVGAPLDGGGPVTAGAHTLQLALPTATGMQAVNVGVSVGGPVPASVPAGDTPSVPVWLVAVWAAGLAGILLASWRRIVTG